VLLYLLANETLPSWECLTQRTRTNFPPNCLPRGGDDEPHCWWPRQERRSACFRGAGQPLRSENLPADDEHHAGIARCRKTRCKRFTQILRHTQDFQQDSPAFIPGGWCAIAATEARCACAKPTQHFSLDEPWKAPRDLLPRELEASGAKPGAACPDGNARNSVRSSTSSAGFPRVSRASTSRSFPGRDRKVLGIRFPRLKSGLLRARLTFDRAARYFRRGTQIELLKA